MEHLDKGELVLDGLAFEYCLKYFQRECSKYWDALGVAEPSHLKVFGHLLFSPERVAAIPIRDSPEG